MNLDLRKYKTVAGAVKAAHKALQGQAAAFGQDPKQVHLWTPEEALERGYSKCWMIMWDEGPFEWAFEFCSGQSIGWTEVAPLIYAETGEWPKQPEQSIHHKGAWGNAEPWHSYSLGFYGV